MIIIGDNSGSIFFVDSDIHSGKLMNTQVSVCDSSIFDLCWYDSRSITVASGEIELMVLDIEKLSTVSLKGHHKTIRCLKKSNQTLFSGGGDGKVFSWDLRVGKPVIEMMLPKKAKNIISAVEIHKEENHLVFASSTPGTTLNTWDIRYTKRGLYLAKETNISAAVTTDIFYNDNFLFFAFSDGSVLRTTETGVFMNYLAINDSYNLSSGKIDLDATKNFILAGSGEKVVVCDPDHPMESNIVEVGQINGINTIHRQHFLAYNDLGDVKIFDLFHGGINFV